MNPRDIVKNLLGIVFVRNAINTLKRELRKDHDISAWILFAYNFHNTIRFLPQQTRWTFSIIPAQTREELFELSNILVRLKPRTLMEIGTNRGGTLFVLTRVSDPNATIISVDLHRGPFGGGYPQWRIPFYKSFASHKQKIHLILGNSHFRTTKHMVTTILGNRTLDFLLIDGDHSYEGVKRDFEMYSSLVRKGGVVAFHDIVSGPTAKVGGVPEFWLEIRGSYKYSEIVRSWSQGGAGIGMLFL